VGKEAGASSRLTSI